MGWKGKIGGRVGDNGMLLVGECNEDGGCRGRHEEGDA